MLFDADEWYASCGDPWLQWFHAERKRLRAEAEAETQRQGQPARANGEASPPAPPQGLYFIGARYPELDEGVDR